MHPAPPCSAPAYWWRVQASALLLRWGSYRWARNLWVLIMYLFFLPVMLPSVAPRLTIDSAMRVFSGVWKPLFLRLPSWDGAPSLPLLSLFLSFIFFPTSFRRVGLLFWVPDVLCRHSEKQPNSSKGGRKKYKRQKKRQKREGRSSIPGRES